MLVNNAGIMRCPKWKTEDGFEMQFGVNHLGEYFIDVVFHKCRIGKYNYLFETIHTESVKSDL